MQKRTRSFLLLFLPNHHWLKNCYQD